MILQKAVVFKQIVPVVLIIWRFMGLRVNIIGNLRGNIAFIGQGCYSQAQMNAIFR